MAIVLWRPEPIDQRCQVNSPPLFMSVLLFENSVHYLNGKRKKTLTTTMPAMDAISYRDRPTYLYEHTAAHMNTNDVRHGNRSRWIKNECVHHHWNCCCGCCWAGGRATAKTISFHSLLFFANDGELRWPGGGAKTKRTKTKSKLK